MFDREPVAAALADMIAAATAGTVYVHRQPPEVINPLAAVISNTVNEAYGTAAFGVDEVELAVLPVGSVEQNNAVDRLKNTIRECVMADTTLKGTVQTAWPTGARGWRQMTGAGGIQLLYVELIITVHQ